MLHRPLGPQQGGASRSLNQSSTPRSSARTNAELGNLLTGASISNSNRNSPRAGTPSTSRSAHSVSLVDLEETIADIIGVRMQSLSELRARVDELSELQRREEDAFQQSMQMVLGQSAAAREAQHETEEDLARMLEQERQQRQRAVELMGMFKREGGSAIAKVKDALRDVQSKYKAELEKNAKLTAQLRRYERNPPPQTPQANQGDDAASSAALQRQVATLSQLLEDEDAIVVELQQRNRALEQKVASLTTQRDRLLDTEAAQLQSDEATEEFRSLFRHVQALDVTPGKIQNMQPTKVFQTIQLIQKFAAMTYRNLKIEQRQRLRVEEQAARMAAAQDHQVRRLEQRVKELEWQLGTSGRGGAGSAASHPDMFHRTNSAAKASTIRAGASLPLNSLQGTHDSTRAGTSTTASATASAARAQVSIPTPADRIVEPRQQEIIGLDNIPSPVPKSFEPSVLSDHLHHSNASVHQSPEGPRPNDGRHNDDGGDEDEISDSDPLPSLEEHLAAVTSEFQASVDAWSKAINAAGTYGIGISAAQATVRDDEFLPDTPAKR